MAQEQKNVTIAAPGFAGINTQDSPLTQGAQWAAIADNCVVDRYGRIGARKGYAVLTTDNTALGTDYVAALHEFVATDGTKVIFSAANNKIFSGTTTLVDETPGAYTITADDWQMATLNDHCFMFQRGHEPLCYEHSTTTLLKMSDKTGYSGTAPQANAVIAAYGRLWAADVTANKYTVYWTDLLQGWDWATGSAGSIDITEVWPRGQDEIVALAAHNNFLLIFGKECIVIYGTSASDGRLSDPTTDLYLQDVIEGIGCVSRHSIQPIGSDLLFLDASGVRSLARVIDERSLPIGDISRNVRRDIKDRISDETGEIFSTFSPEEGFYLVGFPSQMLVYCFDMRGLLEDGSARTTTWSGVPFTSAHYLQDGTLFFGTTDGVTQYTLYTDDGSGYLMYYLSNPITFDSPAVIKIPKQLDVTLIGGEGSNVTLLWSYDYTDNNKTRTVSLSNAGGSYYNVAEYGLDEYSSSNTLSQTRVNLSGSGRALAVGMQTTVNGASIDVQEFNIQALIGRIL